MLLEKITEKLLLRCWQEIYNSKSNDVCRISKGSDQVTLKKFNEKKEENIKEIVNNVKSGRFKFDQLLPVPLPKGNGKYRVLTVPTVKDRIVHKALLSIITSEVYPFINTEVSYCGVKKDYFKKNSEALNVKSAFARIIDEVKAGRYWIFESDLKSFFDNVDKARTLEKLKKILPDSSLLPFFDSIIHFEVSGSNFKELSRKGVELKTSNNKGISQGSALSPMLSNIFLIDFDCHMRKIFGKRFIRYIDDFIVICESEEEATFAKKTAKDFLSAEELELSEDPDPNLTKTKIVNLKANGKINFLGFAISRHKISHKKKLSVIKQWINDKVLNWKKYKNVKRNGKPIATIELINEKIKGWAQYLSFIDVKNSFKEIETILESKRLSHPSKYGKLISLKTIKVEPIISNTDWKNLF